ncbi:hypothetical protein BACERE00177_01360 [Bacillus mobilis]|nr:hypothetical protein BACERE00177_01360 [Bacillus mobilis]
MMDKPTLIVIGVLVGSLILLGAGCAVLFKYFRQ